MIWLKRVKADRVADEAPVNRDLCQCLSIAFPRCRPIQSDHETHEEIARLPNDACLWLNMNRWGSFTRSLLVYTLISINLANVEILSDGERKQWWRHRIRALQHYNCTVTVAISRNKFALHIGFQATVDTEIWHDNIMAFDFVLIVNFTSNMPTLYRYFV